MQIKYSSELIIIDMILVLGLTEFSVIDIADEMCTLYISDGPISKLTFSIDSKGITIGENFYLIMDG
jgi:hypothetical protein